MRARTRRTGERRARQAKDASGRNVRPAGVRLPLQLVLPATASDAGPAGGDLRFRRLLLRVARELHPRVELRRRQGPDQRLRDLLVLGEVLEPRRMRIALEPDQLSLVR